jgi:hypothetical protein
MYRRSLQPSKENIQHFKHGICFLWFIFTLLDPDPADQNQADQSGSGSTTLDVSPIEFMPQKVVNLISKTEMSLYRNGSNILLRNKGKNKLALWSCVPWFYTKFDLESEPYSSERSVSEFTHYSAGR